MLSNSTNASGPRVIPVADIEQSVDGQIASLDPQRAQSLSDLAAVRAAKASTLTAEQRLLTLKLGANDPQVAAVAARAAANTALQQSLATEIARTHTPAPATGPQSYVFHGYVLDGRQKPLPQLTVALYDAQNQWFRPLGYGCTDQNGYFLLRYDQGQPQPAPSPQPPPPTPAPAPSPQPTPMPSPAPQPGPTPQPTPLPTPAPTPSPVIVKPLPIPGPVVRPLGAAAPAGVTGDVAVVTNVDVKGPLTLSILVFGQQQNLLYRDPQPLTPQLGQVDYRVIIIDGQALTCVPPPATPTTGTPGGGGPGKRPAGPAAPPAAVAPAKPAPARAGHATAAPKPAASRRAEGKKTAPAPKTARPSRVAARKGRHP